MVPENSSQRRLSFLTKRLPEYLPLTTQLVEVLTEIIDSRRGTTDRVQMFQKHVALDTLDVLFNQGVTSLSPLSQYSHLTDCLGETSYSWSKLGQYLDQDIRSDGLSLIQMHQSQSLSPLTFERLKRVMVAPSYLEVGHAVDAWYVAIPRLGALGQPVGWHEAYRSLILRDAFVQMIREISITVCPRQHLVMVMIRRVTRQITDHISDLHYERVANRNRLAYARFSLVMTLCYVCLMRSKLDLSLRYIQNADVHEASRLLDSVVNHLCHGVLHGYSSVQ